jgi:hypothetical protein
MGKEPEVGCGSVLAELPCDVNDPEEALASLPQGKVHHQKIA